MVITSALYSATCSDLRLLPSWGRNSERNRSAIGAVSLDPDRDAVVAGHVAADKQPMAE